MTTRREVVFLSFDEIRTIRSLSGAHTGSYPFNVLHKALTRAREAANTRDVSIGDVVWGEEGISFHVERAK